MALPSVTTLTVPETNVGTTDTTLISVPLGFTLRLRSLRLRNTTTSDIVVTLKDGAVVYASFVVPASQSLVLREDQVRHMVFRQAVVLVGSAAGVKASAEVELQ